MRGSTLVVSVIFITTKGFFQTYSAGIDFSRLCQTSTDKVDPRAVRVKITRAHGEHFDDLILYGAC